MIAAWPCPGSSDGEYAVSFDRKRDARLLVIPALFDEANKLRRLSVETMRRLDNAGIDSFLPDIPGWNESMELLEKQTLEDWRHACAAAARHFVATHVLAIRAGALLAPVDLPGWGYAPIGGASALRALLRARVIAAREMGENETRDELLAQGREEGLQLAGYNLGPQMIGALADADLPDSPSQRDIAAGDLGGAGLWLRAEPGDSAEQADCLAAIIAREIAGGGAP